VALNLTRRCNQRCGFCFEGDRAGWDEPDRAEVERRLAETATRQRAVIFMGAEALLRPDILAVIRYARTLGLTVAAFTNGQVLARPGFVADLVEAGLESRQVSVHYADGDSFAEGTGTPARLFERSWRGLSNVAAFNRAYPERRLRVVPKTVLFRANYLRLARLRQLLEQTLGDSFDSYFIGGMSPTPTRRPGALLEPFAGRRDELGDFLRDWSAERRLAFSMVPLCQIPGHEHRSFDVRTIAFGVAIDSNFEDKSRLARMHDYVGISFLDATPLDTPAKREAVRRFARGLAAAERAAASGRGPRTAGPR
jgi:MoaA/NifB/PqqE/SkfB family radical SAM enzyme